MHGSCKNKNTIFRKIKSKYLRVLIVPGAEINLLFIKINCRFFLLALLSADLSWIEINLLLNYTSRSHKTFHTFVYNQLKNFL